MEPSGRPWTRGPDALVQSSINGGRNLDARTAVWVEAIWAIGIIRTIRLTVLTASDCHAAFEPVPSQHRRTASAIATPLFDQLCAFAARLSPTPPCHCNAAFRPCRRVAASPFSHSCVASHPSAGCQPVLWQAVAPATAPTATTTVRGGSGSGGVSATSINN